MDPRVRKTLLWTWTAAMLLSFLGFGWRGAAPRSATFFSGMTAPQAALFRAVNWFGAVVSLGFAGVPWFRPGGDA